MTVIDDYVAGFDGAHRELMEQLRDLIRTLVPDAGEKIGYGMPTFTLNGNLVHFAAGKNHVGLYPAPDGVTFAAEELDRLGLKYSKGAIQFPLDRALPVDLITRIVLFRTEQQRAKR